jgi:hypothetical protein
MRSIASSTKKTVRFAEARGRNVANPERLDPFVADPEALRDDDILSPHEQTLGPGSNAEHSEALDLGDTRCRLLGLPY